MRIHLPDRLDTDGFKIGVIGVRGIPNVTGGIETHCEQMYPRLVAKASHVNVDILTRDVRDSSSCYHYKGITIYPLRVFEMKGFGVVIYTLMSLVRARTSLHPDIIALHGIGPGFFAPLSRMLGFKTVVTYHAEDFRRPKWGKLTRLFLRAGELSTCLAAHRVICVSQYLHDLLARRYPFVAPKLIAIRNGAQVPAGDGIDDAGILEQLGLKPGGYVLAAGRIEATKGFHDLVNAHARSDRSAMPLVIAGEALGDESYMRELSSRASAQVRFVGPQFAGKLSALYRHAAVFVHPSHMEGYGLVVAEALAHGASVILSDIPPHREFGLDDASYFAPGDVEALTRRLNEPDFRVFRSEQAMQQQRLNSWDIAACLHLALFRSLMPESSASATPSSSDNTVRKNDQ